MMKNAHPLSLSNNFRSNARDRSVVLMKWIFRDVESNICMYIERESSFI